LPTRAFPFRFATAYRLAARAFGVSERSALILVTDDELRVQFGPWRVATRLANIAGTTRTGPFRFVKTAGPARLTFSDRGLTFATNSENGVCLDFHDPIPGIEPTGRLRHPNLTLTPVDCDALIAAVSQERVEAP
jgi:hypothetical protein